MFLLLPASGVQQHAPTPVQPGITIRTQTELVLVPVVVNDKSGAHVSNLHRDNFQVFENGKPQNIRMFEEVIAAPANKSARIAGEYTNFLSDDASARRLTIILLDLVNTPYLNQQFAREELLKALSTTLNTDDPKALLTLTRSGIRVLHDFTTDPAVLAAALRTAGAQNHGPTDIDSRTLAAETTRLNSFRTPADTEWDMRVRERWVIEETLAAMQHLAKAFEGVPGRKALIWATAGFPFPLGIARSPAASVPRRQSAPSFSMPGPELFPLCEKTYRMFHSANIAIYSVDVRGLVNESYRDVSSGSDQDAFFRWARNYREESTTTLLNFAQETGGKAFVGFSDVARGFRAALDDSRSYYLLGYYLDRANAAPGWHNLKVKLSRPAADVRSRAGFFVPARSATVEIQKNETETALSSPLNYTAVPLALRFEPATEVAGNKRINFVLRIPSGGFTIDTADNNHAELELTAATVNQKGQVKATKAKLITIHFKPDSLRKVLADGFLYRSSFDVPPGEYTGRIMVRDLLSGRIGTISVPLSVSP